MEIIVICCGREERWDCRERAIDFYRRAIDRCELNEIMRYVNIYRDLVGGKRLCKDSG